MSKKKRLTDAYRFQGFTPSETVQGIFGDPKARVIHLNRSKKKQFARYVGKFTGVIMIASIALYVISRLVTHECILIWRYVVSNAGGVVL
jgi:hypothetical protein